MEVIETITAIVSLVVAIITSVIAILQKLKVIKADKVSEELITLQKLSDKINEFAIVAEANGGTGEEKKQFVLNSIKAISQEYNWTYNEEWVSETLEMIIDLTKKINNKGAE